MQNRFRFRMYNNKTKVMIYDVETINDRFVSFSDNKDIILMQCIGLKDKNKKEIYEGDVISLSGNDNPYMNKMMGIVKFSKKYAMFFIDIPNNFAWYDFVEIERKGIEVIGDIYTNPELVEKANANNSKI